SRSALGVSVASATVSMDFPSHFPMSLIGGTMALTNIELYEALKRDLSEDSARMIAEVVPPAGDLTTKADFAELARYVEERLSKTDRRIGAYGLALLVPVWGATVAALLKFVIEL
ncbi:MAG: hypothetical protein WD826_11740, partial [Actinomycetota bacterium]